MVALASTFHPISGVFFDVCNGPNLCWLCCRISSSIWGVGVSEFQRQLACLFPVSRFWPSGTPLFWPSWPSGTAASCVRDLLWAHVPCFGPSCLVCGILVTSSPSVLWEQKGESGEVPRPPESEKNLDIYFTLSLSACLRLRSSARMLEFALLIG